MNADVNQIPGVLCFYFQPLILKYFINISQNRKVYQSPICLTWNLRKLLETIITYEIPSSRPRRHVQTFNLNQTFQSLLESFLQLRKLSAWIGCVQYLHGVDVIGFKNGLKGAVHFNQKGVMLIDLSLHRSRKLRSSNAAAAILLMLHFLKIKIL